MPNIVFRLASKYKQFLCGLVTGVGVLGGAILWGAATGHEPFQTVPLVIREIKGDTFVQTPRFSILYRGVSGVNVGGSLTIAGRRGDVSAPWSGGYVTSWNGSATGIDHINLYDASEGVATVYVAGQLFRVLDGATRLKVANLVVDLRPGDRPIVVVERNKYAHVSNGSETKALLATFNALGDDYESVAAPQRS